MKIMAVWGKVLLKNEPDWLLHLRERNNNFYEYHVTLKQPCWIDESQLPKIEQQLSDCLAKFKVLDHSIELNFNKLEVDETDGIILLFARNQQLIASLQKEIVSCLANYGNYVSPESEEYEANFRPHLTLAFDLSPDEVKSVSNLIPNNPVLNGRITQLVLSAVKEINPKEATNPSNFIIYSL
ncbi:2'-5' RNA ligase family protein [Candidatus Berkelbacteria bacterium]|nr:2'-5' RNA ligase family protein [Candidatus Berkelbacteria bacterium]